MRNPRLWKEKAKGASPGPARLPHLVLRVKFDLIDSSDDDERDIELSLRGK